MEGNDGSGPRERRPEWTLALKQFELPSGRKAAWQLITTLLPYFGFLVLMYYTTRWNWPVWGTILLAIPAGAFLIRLFIFFHDCVHGSFVRSPRAITVLGNILGILTFTPFSEWRRTHGVHHSTAGNLDRRGVGDVWTMTVEEYLESKPLRRLLYRFVRNPLVMLGFGPLAMFLIMNRIPGPNSNRRHLLNLMFTNLALAAIILAAAFTIGIKTYLLIQLPIVYFAGIAGIWLFYVQHQFDPSYWARGDAWDSMKAAMQGSSYYKLPRVLQWVTGNIGLHHVHHLRPRIPNYNLQRCLDAIPELRLVRPLTFKRSFGSARMNIWDEKNGTLLSFKALSALLRQRPRPA